MIQLSESETSDQMLRRVLRDLYPSPQVLAARKLARTLDQLGREMGMVMGTFGKALAPFLAFAEALEGISDE